MQIRLFRSATVGVSSDGGTKILCDPWLTDGAYIGSWHHWPPLEGDEFERVLAEKWDAVYVSHLHPDHFDRKFVASLARRQPHCLFVIPGFGTPWLRRAIENCGVDASRLLEVPSGQTVSIGDVALTVLQADHCDPQSCGLSVPCHEQDPRLAAIDSLALFRADGQSILNANDALAVSSVWRALKVVGRVDFLLGHYGGAGPFPQCFVDRSPAEMREDANRVARDFVDRLAKATELTGARYVMPFAGQYVLGGRLSDLNEYRSVWPISKVRSHLRDQVSAEVITPSPFSSFSLSQESLEDVWCEPPVTVWDNYRKRLELVAFPYEKSEEPDWNARQAVQAATPRVKAAFEASQEFTSSGGDCAIIPAMPGLDEIAIEFVGQDCSLVEPKDVRSPNMTRLEGDPRLWKRLLLRRPQYRGFTPYHFNQAEIGSHFTWSRSGPYRPELRFLNFLQTP